MTTPSSTHPTTGLPDLDVALGGLLWGDNVVWVVDGGTAEPFFRSIAAVADRYDSAMVVAVERDPEALQAALPDAVVLDARPGTALGAPAALLQTIRRRLEGARREGKQRGGGAPTGCQQRFTGDGRRASDPARGL